MYFEHLPEFLFVCIFFSVQQILQEAETKEKQRKNCGRQEGEHQTFCCKDKPGEAQKDRRDLNIRSADAGMYKTVEEETGGKKKESAQKTRCLLYTALEQKRGKPCKQKVWQAFVFYLIGTNIFCRERA